MNLSSLMFRPPLSGTEWQQYYDLRWRVLRMPWNQAPGSEKDELEESSFHLAAFDSNNIIYAVGRLNKIDNEIAQIRYMAVEPKQQRIGIGALLLKNLEEHARLNGAKCISLNARDDYLEFYIKNGYQANRKGHTLFETITHTVAIKNI